MTYRIEGLSKSDGFVCNVNNKITEQRKDGIKKTGATADLVALLS